MSCHSVSLELGQPEWEKYPDSKLHMIVFLVLSVTEVKEKKEHCYLSTHRSFLQD